jgi:hypothetical protein
MRRGLTIAAGLAILLTLLVGVATANHSVYRQITVGEINGNGAFAPDFKTRISADGTRVFFDTQEKLVAADTDNRYDAYERSGGTTKLVTVGQINGNGPFEAGLSGVSADGTRVFFDTSEQLVATDTDGVNDVYERSGGTTTLVSAGQINGNGNSFIAKIEGSSADGTRVFFSTHEQLVNADSDSSADIYERSAGTTKLVSAGQVNGNGAFDPSFRGVSADGKRVFFETTEPLIGADTDTAQDVYERAGGTTRRVSTGLVNGNGAFSAGFSGASADGTRIFFKTNEKLVGADADASQQDIYERAAGTTKLVTAGQINGNGNLPASFNGASADGKRVFFATNEQLVTADTDTSQDVYERSAATTSKISDGNSAFDAFFADASADGTVVIFSTQERLVHNDIDGRSDIYQRLGGTTTRVSIGQINGNGAFNPSEGRISADGARIFFVTLEKLVSGDTDAEQDIYERSSAGRTSPATTKISLGNGAYTAGFSGMSADGSTFLFDTPEPLLGDADSSADIFGAYVAP